MNKINWSIVKILVLVMACLELFWGLPVIGGSIIVMLVWIPLIINLIVHIGLLIACIITGEKIAPSVMGIVASVVGFIPFVGMVLHLVAGGYGLYSILGVSSKSDSINNGVNVNVTVKGNKDE